MLPCTKLHIKNCSVSEGIAPTDLLVMEGKLSAVLIPKPSTGYEHEPVQCISHYFHNIAFVNFITCADIISMLLVVNRALLALIPCPGS
jgi:hypothetical protein